MLNTKDRVKHTRTLHLFEAIAKFRHPVAFITLKLRSSQRAAMDI